MNFVSFEFIVRQQIFFPFKESNEHCCLSTASNDME